MYFYNRIVLGSLLPGAAWDPLPHFLQTWLRNYIAGCLLYLVTGFLWCFYIYHLYRNVFLPKGTYMPFLFSQHTYVFVVCNSYNRMVGLRFRLDFVGKCTFRHEQCANKCTYSTVHLVFLVPSFCFFNCLIPTRVLSLVPSESSSLRVVGLLRLSKLSMYEARWAHHWRQKLNLIEGK